ncbi:MAG: saccharopine dehydrogenase [Chloroflexi bacterium HGW-Chloroflexi-1]|nr:MAG: saccharopine dehydrogenase [Chloroflexi bacterium HGW-Chloroflexi-1]
MKKVLVLGAGMVAGAHVRYLLDQPGFHVTVASRTLSKAQEIVQGHPRGAALQLDSDDAAAMERLISQADLAVSLLPYAYHPVVAQHCVKHRVHMVTTSYVKDATAALDRDARAAGVILLNEIGVDPGIDHMTAMRVIHQVQAAGGEIVSFTSWCGGLPAPEANANPLGYKFSWSPRGVLLASKNSAHYLRERQDVTVPGPELFDHRWTVPIEVEGQVIDFEGYPNRDSLPYMQTYGITTARSMFRGTLRNVGWCDTLSKLIDLGWLDETPRDDLAGLTFAQLTARLIGSSRENLAADLVGRLQIAEDSPVMRNLVWLGLLSDNPLPLPRGAAIDILTARMLATMSYAPGERDMLLMQHQFLAAYPDRQEKITSTMVDFGIPHGDSSMARTVGLPAATGVRLILEGKIDLPGVQIPVLPAIYEPVLDELEALGIHFSEVWEQVQ